VRKSASSIAESPPPTTAISCPRKKKPSHVAHVDSPWPIKRDSASRPSMIDCAPVATMIDSARCSSSSIHTPKGDPEERSTFVTFAVISCVPNRLA
jgi:hypothetical protein